MLFDLNFIGDLPEFTFYDNIINIFGIKQFIQYVNINYEYLEELKKIKEHDILDFDIYYDFDYEDKYII
jgi:hypothetical protein